MLTTRASDNCNPEKDCNSGNRATILRPISKGSEASATTMEFLASELEVRRSMIDQQNSRMEDLATNL